ncbi:hypothetical protein DXT88_18530 [Herbaspirillum lusitanum]|nr:hypothetical protein [Herbaspirillum lusitanum]
MVKEKDVLIERFRFGIGTQLYSAYYVRELNKTSLNTDKFASFFDANAFECHLQADIYQDSGDFSHAELAPPIGAVIKIKKGRDIDIEQWAAKLLELEAEARESIAQEGIRRECWFSFSIAGSRFLFGYMEKLAFNRISNETPRELAVDRIHKDFKQSWDRDQRIECCRVSAAMSTI